jgi:MoaA/NifB/PqqE/SkfB family radical SAM enzyme
MIKRTVSFSRDTTNLFFHILTACNLSCRHCYINPPQHGRETLPAGTIDKWLSAFAEKIGETGRANVIFLGGEPTLHPDLPFAVKRAKELGYGSVTIDTNGYLFHDILDKVTPGEVDYFSFSLDGPTPETNDPLRGDGAFARCTAGIRDAVRKGFNTSLIYTVSRDNIAHLDRMPALVADLGIDRFFIQVIGIRGKSAVADKPLQLTREEWFRAVPPVAREAADLGVVTIYPRVFLEEGEPFECAGAVADNYFIFPNGRVYRCPLCEDFPLHGFEVENDALIPRPRPSETDLFTLTIPEGCVMNKLFQPDNIAYDPEGLPLYRIACCMLKEEVRPDGPA